MGLVPRLLGIALVASALAGGGGAALAGGELPGNSDSASLPLVLPPSAEDALLPADNASSFGLLSQKFGFQNSHLDFFSVQQDRRSGDFTSLLGNSAGGGGVKFQFKW